MRPQAWKLGTGLARWGLLCPATDTGGEDEPPSVPGVPRGARQSPAKPRLERRARFRTYIPPMETVAHVRSEKAGTVSVALLAGRM